MFKFKCDKNFTDIENVSGKISRDYNNPNNDYKYDLTIDGSTTSKLADRDYYLFVERGSDDTWYLGKSTIDFPELLDISCKSCLTTNDGLVIFNFDDDTKKWCIVYDLVFDNNIDFGSISDDIINHIELIEHHKYTSPRVHCLDIDESGNIIPKVIFKDNNVTMYDNKDIISLDTHFSLDIDLNITYRIENGIKYDINTNEKYSSSTSEIGRDTNIGIDEYGYYVCEYFEGLFSTDKLKIDNISIDTLSKILVSDKKIENSTRVPYDKKEFYYMLSDGNSFKIRLDSDVVPCKIYLCY